MPPPKPSRPKPLPSRMNWRLMPWWARIMDLAIVVVYLAITLTTTNKTVRLVAVAIMLALSLMRILWGKRLMRSTP
jgi:hypothetical protein